MKYDLEKYIIENIFSKKWDVNTKLPKEIELMELSNLSKMSVRKVIARLKNKGIVYSLQGSGVYVSPFFNFNKITSLSEDIKSTKFNILPTESKIPVFMLKNFNYDEDKLNNLKPFIKFYLDNESNIRAYSMNWIFSDELVNVKKMAASKEGELIYIQNKFEKIIKINKLEKASQVDENIFVTKYDFLPTIYSYYLNKKGEVVMFRIAKIKPEFFKSIEVKQN